MTTGQIIRAIRESRGLTQLELSVAAGCTPAKICLSEQDKNLGIAVTKRIAVALNIPVALLLVTSDQSNRPYYHSLLALREEFMRRLDDERL